MARPHDVQTVEDWRRTELLECGFPPRLAAEVARDERYDLQQLMELLDDGCPPALAVRILSPLATGDPR